MSAFVSTPPATAAPAPIDDAVPNDGWYPPLSLSETRAILAITTAIPDARLRDALQGAMLSINRQLRTWRDARQVAGATDLASAGTDRVSAAELALLYPRAVRAATAAELVDQQHQLSATDGGRERDGVMASPADGHRRLATHCVRDIQGRRRTKVRLV
ncbi:head completion/stabilization protein [Sphingomonas sp. PL-96]|uniref:head completion/stabilization protein n=1 Tax=Sphingomonas sp. PL-96 TaxID=2887201 RepID=UPI001E62E037|nr:head completion/stabilization protein [Sphingomonas sp. PL-96]MCC2976253.1 head completion/stabilization protein [Sphingomonas sp. PL-96]